MVLLTVMIIIFLVFVGACFGSFVNALIWRMHEQASDSQKSNVRKSKASKTHNSLASTVSSPDLSILTGRSMCPNCKHQLAAKDLIPVFSWLQLWGKCRYCKVRFADTPTTELIMPLLFVVSYLNWPLGWGGSHAVLFGFWLLFLVGFLALSVYDLKWYLLPNKLVYPMIALAVIQVFYLAILSDNGLHVVLRSLYGLLVGGGIFYLLFQLSDGKWIGGGDVKLGFMLGLIVGGPFEALLFIFIASCLGTLVAIPMLLSGKFKPSRHIPFGPFLMMAAVIVFLFGTNIISWYSRLIGIS